MASHENVLWVYIGTYTSGESLGIYQGLFHTETGRLELVGSTRGILNPSFLAVEPTRRCLYAVSEVDMFGRQPTGGVFAYQLDAQTGQPRLLNSQSSGGAGPCHLCVDRAGRFVLTANYGSGSVALLPLHSDGSLAAASAIVTHHGSGPDTARQSQPHAHSVLLDPANRWALSADLGTDQLLIYEPNPETGTLPAHDPPFAAAPAGSGPRHSAFHPSGRFLYTITELASTIIVWEYEGRRGTLQEVEVISTLPEGFSGKSSTSGIQVHPSGEFLYGANRGPDTIAVFAIDSETGRLTPGGHVPSGGRNPRDLALDPTGTYLLALHQDSGTAVSFCIDPLRGALTPTGESAGVPGAACLVFLP